MRRAPVSFRLWHGHLGKDSDVSASILAVVNWQFLSTPIFGILIQALIVDLCLVDHLAESEEVVHVELAQIGSNVVYHCIDIIIELDDSDEIEVIIYSF